MTVTQEVNATALDVPEPPPSPQLRPLDVEDSDAVQQEDEPDMKEDNYREWRVLPVACLTSIATIIGSGILALPVTLYHTAVPVFLILFTVTLLAQVAVIYVVIELIQRARDDISYIHAPPDFEQLEHPSSTTEAEPSSPSYDSISPSPKPAEISLFTLAHLYLSSRFLRYVYYFSTMLCFVSILVSYGLAGPQAVWQLMTAGPSQSHPPHFVFAAYWALGTVAVVFFVDQLLGVFGSFTVLKGSLFVGVVIIVAALPASARVSSLGELMSDFSGWERSATPFLMACVALGGLANTLPVTYRLLPHKPTPGQVRRYRGAIVLAAVLCYLLNVGWVLAVLQVVPREDPTGGPSLTNAYLKGQISTVPLIDALHHGNAVKGDVLRAIEIIVELFILVSTGVSFFVTAAGMKSFVDGGVHIVNTGTENAWRKRVTTIVAYVCSFGLVLTIILANPNGFIAVLTRFSSFTINLQAGLMLFIMFLTARTMRKGLTSIEEGKGSAEGISSPSIPSAMSPALGSSITVYGIIFFSLSCLLASVGPFLGISLSARE